MSSEMFIKTTPIDAEYVIVCNEPRLIAGTGLSGGVLRCTRLVDGQRFALKFLKYNSNNIKEISAWRACSPHPNIVSLVDVFDTGALPAGHPFLGAEMVLPNKQRVRARAPGRYLIAVMEDMAGGDLFDLVSSTRLTERTVKEIVAQAVVALHHIHMCGYVHCDIKLENLLLRVPSKDGIHVCVCDFGFTRAFEIEMCPRGRNYTRAYIAPETIDSFNAQDYCGDFLPVGPSCDMWALGVTAYVLLGRRMPFFTQDTEPGANDDYTLTNFLRTRIAEGQYPPLEAFFSPAAHDFVASLLRPTVDARPTALQALRHPWLAACATARLAVEAADVAVELLKLASGDAVQHDGALALTDELPTVLGDALEVGGAECMCVCD